MTSIDLSTHPVTPTSFGRWQPLNAPLGVTAFGISAVVCDPDEPFTIDHDEVETGQQEVYIVVAGRAQFTIGEETVEAGPGEIVAIADPAVTRGFIALDPVTGSCVSVRRLTAKSRPTGVDHRCRGRGRHPRPLTRPAVRARRPPRERGRSRRRCCSEPRRPNRPASVFQAESLHQLEGVVVAVPHEVRGRRVAGRLRQVRIHELNAAVGTAGRARGCRTP